MMADLLPLTIEDLIGCAEREVKKRLHVYPRLIEAKRMRQEVADREIEMMRTIVERLKQSRRASLGE